MFIFKKKFHSYLYIFFFTLFFIFNKFSTNVSLAKNFNVEQIDIVESYDINFDKKIVIEKAFRKAFKILIYKILEKNDRSKLENTSQKEIKRLIENFSIVEENFKNNNYLGKFEVQFNRKKILNLLEKKQLVSSSPNKVNAFLLPILIDSNSNELFYLNQNIFFRNWNKFSKKYFLINYILPNEDIEDYLIIKKNINDLENYNFEEIIDKYSINNYIVLIISKKANEINIFSKIKFKKENLLFNKVQKNFNINNINDVNELINVLKENYEDKWKSVNKVNTSIVLPVRMSLDSNNYVLTKKFENILKNLDYVSSFRIEKFNNEKIIYKVIFNNNPDIFVEKMLLLNFKIDTSSDIWKIK